ncbi:hypothetical protein ABGB17_20255 [Sphaerisporangium sp. B11E5]|uniref:DUF6907 domain-containing protein n=1 Tax=Sphaerisporangium sp. B11E5 TaxID=3153563 RepID=UPI00325E25ED
MTTALRTVLRCPAWCRNAHSGGQVALHTHATAHTDGATVLAIRDYTTIPANDFVAVVRDTEQVHVAVKDAGFLAELVATRMPEFADALRRAVEILRGADQ